MENEKRILSYPKLTYNNSLRSLFEIKEVKVLISNYFSINTKTTLAFVIVYTMI